MTIDYGAASVTVRGDFASSHEQFWQRLQRPGAWWTSEQKIQIAREVRQAPSCLLCADRKAALSPSSVDGRHDASTALPDFAVEVIHRVTTDSGRLTKSWYDAVIEAGLSPEAYVEIIGTLVAIVSIDSFSRGLGLGQNELPAPGSGDPTGYRPATAIQDEAWVPMIPADGNSGAEADLWTSGRTGNVIRAMSLVPDEVRTLGSLSAAHYLQHAQVGDFAHVPDRALTRSQIELIAGRVSALNQCFY